MKKTSCIACLLAASALAVAAHAETVGYPLIARSFIDSGSGGEFALTGSPFTASGTLVSFSFYDTFPAGNLITPLIWEQVGSNFEITGIGTTETDTGAGLQTYSFGLTAGSDLVGPGLFFGWKHGSVSARNTGVPEWTAAGPGSVTWFGDNSVPLTVTAVGTPVATFARTYSIDATSVSTPEPGTLALGAAGIILGALFLRRAK